MLAKFPENSRSKKNLEPIFWTRLGSYVISFVSPSVCQSVASPCECRNPRFLWIVSAFALAFVYCAVFGSLWGVDMFRVGKIFIWWCKVFNRRKKLCKGYIGCTRHLQVSCISVYPMPMGLLILDAFGSGRRCSLTLRGLALHCYWGSPFTDYRLS